MFVCSFDMFCEYVNSAWYIVGNVKNCYARNLTLKTSGQFIDSVNGDTTTILDDVFGFWVENEVCHYIPQKIVAFMPNLKALGLSNSGLRTISKFDLAPFPELIRIGLYGNQLEYIDGDLFSLNTKIQSINLEDNNLLIINGPILKPLKLLNYVTFKLQCLQSACEYSGCIPEIIEKFSRNCEFDSIYPGFTKYFESLKFAGKTCSNVLPLY